MADAHTIKAGRTYTGPRGDAALLIVAAPDLLEACKGLLAHLWDNHGKRNVRKDYGLLVAEVAARAAIAKAAQPARRKNPGLPLDAG